MLRLRELPVALLLAVGVMLAGPVCRAIGFEHPALRGWRMFHDTGRGSCVWGLTDDAGRPVRPPATAFRRVIHAVESGAEPAPADVRELCSASGVSLSLRCPDEAGTRFEPFPLSRPALCPASR